MATKPNVRRRHLKYKDEKIQTEKRLSIIRSINLSPPFFGTPEKKPRSRSGSRFDPAPREIPYRIILGAGILCLVGAVVLAIGLFLRFRFHIYDVYDDRMFSLLILGALMFIPGAYHVHISVHAYLETDGYSFEDISRYE